MKVTLEKVPKKHPRPFKSGDLVRFRGKSATIYILLESRGENRFRWVCLHPFFQTGAGSGDDIFDNERYELFEGCITLCNDEE